MTIEQVKREKEDMEHKIKRILSSFERETGTVVTNITLDRVQTLGGSDMISNLEMEIKI